VAPLVCFELRNKKIVKELTPHPNHFLDIISKYTSPLFSTNDHLMTYAMNIMGDSGTHIFVFDLKNKKK
jgi:hypothetical protein